jgi:hypothetical protein
MATLPLSTKTEVGAPMASAESICHRRVRVSEHAAKTDVAPTTNPAERMLHQTIESMNTSF